MGKDAAEIRGTIPTQTGWAQLYEASVRMVVARPGAWPTRLFDVQQTRGSVAIS